MSLIFKNDQGKITGWTSNPVGQNQDGTTKWSDPREFGRQEDFADPGVYGRYRPAQPRSTQQTGQGNPYGAYAPGTEDTYGLPPGEHFGQGNGYTHSLYVSQSRSPSAGPYSAYRPSQAQPKQQQSQGTPYGTGSNASQNDSQWGVGGLAYSRPPQAGPRRGDVTPEAARGGMGEPPHARPPGGPSVMGWPDSIGQQFGRRDGYTHSLYGSQSKSPSAGPYSAYRPSQAQPVQQQGQGTPYGQQPSRGYGTPAARRGQIRTAEFRDSDSDGVDDRDQDGPGRPAYQGGYGGQKQPSVNGGRLEDTNPALWSDSQWREYNSRPQSPYADSGGYYRDSSGQVFRSAGLGGNTPLSPRSQQDQYGWWGNSAPPTSQGTPYGQQPTAPRGDGSNYRGYQDDMRALNTWGRDGDPTKNYWQPQQPPPSASQGGYGPSYGFTMPGMSFGGGQPTQSNAGNAANNPYNRPPPFTSQMTDGYGNPTNINQFYGQQQDMIGNLLQRLGQQNQGTYLGPGNPPPSFFAPPQFDVQGMWNQAGQQGRFMAQPGYQGAAPSDTPYIVNDWVNGPGNQPARAPAGWSNDAQRPAAPSVREALAAQGWLF